MQTPMDMKAPSIDDLFVESEWATRWQVLMIVAVAVLNTYPAAFIYLPTFYKPANLQITCGDPNIPEYQVEQII